MVHTLTRAAETTLDRTRILDIEKLWPDPLDCPDWPIEFNHGHTQRRYNGRKGRDGAVEQLERLGELLNRGGRLHKPTAEEREDAFNRVFTRGGASFRPAQELGLDLSPLDRTTEKQAEMIIQAAHVRGYIRKLDALQARAAEDEKRRKTEAAQKTVDGFAVLVDSSRKELTELAEAEARHRQRIEDERAFARCSDIRKNLMLAHGEARMAAHQLGVEEPPKPAFFL